MQPGGSVKTIDFGFMLADYFFKLWKQPGLNFLFEAYLVMQAEPKSFLARQVFSLFLMLCWGLEFFFLFLYHKGFEAKCPKKQPILSDFFLLPFDSLPKHFQT